jgi:hypothetical protein
MKQSFFSALALIALLSACSKSDSGSQTVDLDEVGFEKAKTFFEENAPKYESFTVNANAASIITTTKGTKISIPAGSFRSLSGQPITGNVTVSVKDLYKSSDMLLSNRPTNSNGQMLLSFGEMAVNATQDGKALQLRDDSNNVRVQVPNVPNPRQGQQAPDILMWDADTSVTTVTSGHNHENIPVNSTVPTNVSRGANWTATGQSATNNFNGTASFKLDKLRKWTNCDAIHQPGNTPITVLGYFTNHFNPLTKETLGDYQPSMLYFKPKNQNILVKLYNRIFNAPAGKEGMLSYQNSFYVGLEGTFLAITFKGDKIYAQMKETTIGAAAPGNNYYAESFVLAEVSEAQLIALIDLLDTK